MVLSVAVILLAPERLRQQRQTGDLKTAAPHTAVNGAFALGPNRESTSSYNNGGLENSIRFLEDWGGRTFQYRGSIVGLWHNQQATADHRCCGSSVLGLTRVAWSDPIGLRSKKHHLVVTSDRKGPGILKLGRQICSLFIRLIWPMEFALRLSHQEGCILNGRVAG